jgi:hypothetical protein
MGYYYHYDNVRDNYSSLIDKLEYQRGQFCGIGTRKIKIRLNKLAKTELNAKLYRLALEIEDKNISAKKYEKYRDMYYMEKSDKIKELIKLCSDNNIVVGYQEKDDFGLHIYIVYFELPHCEQISWHTYDVPHCNEYEKEWDGKENSTLQKLEKAIMAQYPNIAIK